MSETVIASRKNVELVNMIDAFSQGFAPQQRYIPTCPDHPTCRKHCFASPCQRSVSIVREQFDMGLIRDVLAGKCCLARLVSPRLVRNVVRQLSWSCDANVPPNFFLCQKQVVFIMASSTRTTLNLQTQSEKCDVFYARCKFCIGDTHVVSQFHTG